MDVRGSAPGIRETDLLDPVNLVEKAQAFNELGHAAANCMSWAIISGILSDDAGQFNILNHALCWIHAERTINKLIRPNEEKRKTLENVLKQIWSFDKDLKAY